MVKLPHVLHQFLDFRAAQLAIKRWHLFLSRADRFCQGRWGLLVNHFAAQIRREKTLSQHRSRAILAVAYSAIVLEQFSGRRSVRGCGLCPANWGYHCDGYNEAGYILPVTV